MSMYSLHSPNLITKFDASGNPIATYETTPTTCTCPAGQRPTCRHRQMLSQLQPICDSHYFLIWDPQGNILHGTIVDFNGTPKHLLDRLVVHEALPEGPEVIAAVDSTIPYIDPMQRGATPAPQPFVRRL